MGYVNDFYTKKAHAKGIRARSYFKLEEIDKKFNFTSKVRSILDLGSAPGSWLQYCSQKTGGRTRLYGVDIIPIADLNLSNITLIQKSVFDLLPEDLPEPVDVILSDMAPKTTGISEVDSTASENLVEKALSLASIHLRDKGIFIAKHLQGNGTSNLLIKMRKRFEKAKIFKPKSSRSFSTEIFFIALSKKN